MFSKITSLAEKHFGYILIIALLFALFVPLLGSKLTFAIPYVLGTAMFLIFLKIDLFEVIAHIKKPFLVIYILLFYLLIVPTITYFIFRYLTSELALGFLLLSAMPPALGSTTLVDIMRGNTSLAFTLSLLAHIVTPFTLPFLIYFFTAQNIDINITGIFWNLFLIIFIPIVLAILIEKLAPKIIQARKKYISGLNVIIFAIFTYIAVAARAEEIISNFVELIPQLIWLYVYFIFAHLAGYFLIFWRKKEDKITTVVCKGYMNNGLGIVIALQYFSPEIAILLVLSDVPWNSLPGILKWSLKYLK